VAKHDRNGFGQPHRRVVNGVETWQVVKVITERAYVASPTGVGAVEVKTKKRLTGTGATQRQALQRLDFNYKRYLVLAGEAPQHILKPTSKELKTTVSDWLDKWFERKRAEKKTAASTLALYERLVKHHVTPTLGSLPLRLVTKGELNTYFRETLPRKRKQVKNEDGNWVDSEVPLLSPSPIRNIHAILNQAFDEALSDELITVNPMDGVRKPEKPQFSSERSKDIIEHHYIPRRVVKGLWGTPELGRWILMFVGLRSSERLGIELSSFRYLEDTTKKTELVVNRQLLRNDADGSYSIKYTTKTKAGNRILVLPDDVSAHLLLWKKQRDEWKRQGLKDGTWKPTEGLENLFFTQPNGQNIRHTKDRYAWARLLGRLKLPHHREHDMRHMTATALGRANIHPEIAKIVIGHSDALMNAYYQHYDKKATEAPLDTIAGHFSKDAKTSAEKKAKTKKIAGVSLLEDGDTAVEQLDTTAVPHLTEALLYGDEADAVEEEATA
jgi:integrase